MKHLNLILERSLLATTVLGLTLMLASASQAGAEVKAKQTPVSKLIGATAEETLPSAGDQKSVSNLRCWQDGTLLFEETNITGRALESARQVLVFDQQSKTGELFLIETGSATCLFKKA